jgi:hypothetical protein
MNKKLPKGYKLVSSLLMGIGIAILGIQSPLILLGVMFFWVGDKMASVWTSIYNI